MRERIAQFLKYQPRNKLVFTPSVCPCLKTLDVGYGLADSIKDKLGSPHLPMIAEDCLKSLVRQSMTYDEIIGDYVAITNWGILFEPTLNFNLLSLFDSFSKTNTLILVNSGHADYENFYLVSRAFNTLFPIGKLHPYILQ